MRTFAGGNTEMKQFCFGFNEPQIKSRICDSLSEVLRGKVPIVCCIGTDAVIGDSLGPLCGSEIRRKLSGKTYIYGTMENPITAMDIRSLAEYIRLVHNDAPILAIDAALGDESEILRLKISDKPIKPGLGVMKELGEIGTSSIIAVVGGKNSSTTLKNVRLSTVYFAAGIISDAVVDYISEIEENGLYTAFRA